jgi:GMP synthase (glutamine-hydrolysing)
MKILFVLHADFERPGAIEIWANEHGFETKYCRPFAGDTTPSVGEFDWLIMMGGPQSPLKLDQYPYLRSEIELTKQALLSGKVVLGFCLGAQVIGEALGARTMRSPNKEVGVFPIQLTEKGSEDPILKGLPKEFPVVHWHSDMPGLTKDALILAESDGCPRQIIKYSERAYGFQCHPEPSRDDVEGMTLSCEADLKPGPFIQSKDKFLSSDFISINKKMHSILNNLFELHETSIKR